MQKDNLTSQNKGQTFKVVFDNSHELIKGHQVYDSGLLPGLAYVDFFLRYAGQINGELGCDFQLRGLSIYEPLIVKPDQKVTINLEFETTEDGWKVSARSPSTETLYATAKVFRKTCSYERHGTFSGQDLAGDFIELERVYSQARKCGLVHSGMVKGQGGVAVTEDDHLLDIRIADEDQASDYLFHPTLMDAALMASGVVIHGVNSQANEKLYLPFYIESFTSCAPIHNRCFAKIDLNSYCSVKGQRVWDVTFFDEQCTEIAHIKGLTTKEINYNNNNKFYSADNAVTGNRVVPTMIDSVNNNYNEAHQEQRLRAIFADYLSVEASQIDLTIGFYELGLASSQLLDVLKDIEDEFGIALSPTLLFEYETLSQLLIYLDSQCTPSAKENQSTMAKLLDMLAQHTEKTASEIGLQDGFYELGLESSSLLDLLKDIECEFGIELNPTLLFEYETLLDLADYIDTQLAHTDVDMNSRVLSESNTEVVPLVLSAEYQAPVKTGLSSQVIQVFAEHLKVDVAQVDINCGLYELGLSSADLLDVVADLEEISHRALNPTLLFEYDSITDLVSFLSDQESLLGKDECQQLPSAVEYRSQKSGFEFFHDEPFLQDHLVFNTPALMGVTAPCVAIQAYKQAVSSPYPIEVQRLKFIGGPLLLSAGKSATLTIHFEDGFSVSAQLCDKRDKELSCEAQAIGTVATTMPDLDIEQVLSQSSQLSADKIEQLYARSEYFLFGDTLKVVESAYEFGEDILICKVNLHAKSKAAGDDGFSFDPLILNACYFYQGKKKHKKLFVPFFIERITQFDDIPSEVYVVNFLKTQKDDFASFDAAVYDLNGQCLAKLDNMSVRSVQQQAFEQLREAAAHQDTQQLDEPRITINKKTNKQDIAVIGMSGRFPKADDIDTFWQNLEAGVDCVSEIPATRWDWREHEMMDRTAESPVHCRWGGFIADIEYFDPLFFNISPREAERVDPQERLFLQESWRALEHAGYTRKALHQNNGIAHKVGVYVGVMSQEYSLFGVESTLKGSPLGLGGGVSSIATRVSYVLDLHGPSYAVDSMCSSSLTAIDLACRDLRDLNTHLAIAGGVNLSVHANKYLMLNEGKFISSKGRCESFGEGGSGYIPAESVGVLILRRLSDAVEDNQHIYGVIKGTHIGHGGKASGYTVPSPHGQHRVIEKAIEKAGIESEHINYIEAHGTGTALGDPVEINGLLKQFSKVSHNEGQIYLGSVKSNLGHAESAAAVVGIIKVLLQMQHNTLVPSLHSSTLNSHIDFASTPFHVVQHTQPWPELKSNSGDKLPRTASVSSFGAGGTNGHIIIAQFDNVHRYTHRAKINAAFSSLILFSAQSKESLIEKVKQLRLCLAAKQDYQLADIAYTLQSGRENMKFKIGLLVDTFDELITSLDALIKSDMEEFIKHAPLLNTEPPRLEQVKTLSGQQLLELWLGGADVPWAELWQSQREYWQPLIIPLPGYPFRKQRCWISDRFADKAVSETSKKPQTTLFELRDISSTQGKTIYQTVLRASDFYIKDHEIRGHNLLPGVAALELARLAINKASGGTADIENLVWVNAIQCQSDDIELQIELHKRDNDKTHFVISKQPELHVFCQGDAIINRVHTVQKLDLAQLQKNTTESITGHALYSDLAEHGFNYGQGMQGLTHLHRVPETHVIAQITNRNSAPYPEGTLHPSVMDAALQATAYLHTEAQQAMLPYCIDQVQVVRPCQDQMYCVVEPCDKPVQPGLSKYDIKLCDSNGNICIKVNGFTNKRMAQVNEQGDSAHLYGVELVELTPIVAGSTPLSSEEHYVIAAGFSEDERAYLAQQLASCVAQFEVIDPSYEIEQLTLKLLELCQRFLGHDRAASIQVILKDSGDGLLGSVEGLLRSIGLEYPNVQTQLIHTLDCSRTSDLDRLLTETIFNYQPANYIRNEHARYFVKHWHELPSGAAMPIWKDGGTYLITGGATGLGMLLAHEIANQVTQCSLILCGRRPLDDNLTQQLQQLYKVGASSRYYSVDVANEAEVKMFAQKVMKKHPHLNGILHSAGLTRDSLTLNKKPQELMEVLNPKVNGIRNIDEAFAHCKLDFFIAFSSVSGVWGNIGQSDYASANAYMDNYLHKRSRLCKKGQRHGHSLSVNWPLWQSGGMGLNDTEQDALKRRSGLSAMPSSVGLEALYRAYHSAQTQVMVLFGGQSHIEKLIGGKSARSQNELAAGETNATVSNNAISYVQNTIAQSISQLLSVALGEIESDSAFNEFGFDSIAFTELANMLNKILDTELMPTVFYEFSTIHELAEYLSDKVVVEQVSEPVSMSENLSVDVPSSSQETAFATEHSEHQSNENAAFAIIGMSGKFPKSRNIDEFWHHLEQGKNCISEVPEERWRWQDVADDLSDDSSLACMWGGFIDGIKEFDPLFFEISPREAELMDPQQRLLMSHVWLAIEDAGYSPQALSGSQTGLFIATASSGYSENIAKSGTGIQGYTATSLVPSIGPNRVSYLLNLHGPSEPIETACSSSLVAIHKAIQAIQSGDCDLAIAGGVNTLISPAPHISFSKAGMLAKDGRCKTFSAQADGYVRGEGIGILVIKPLEAAKADADDIYAVILGSAVNHGGRANSLTAPNQKAQSDLLVRAYQRAGVNPRMVSYIEAHGTGTSLGDPIEINGLKEAFNTLYKTSDELEGDFVCALGSVKTNIGHLELAAGVAGVIKVVQQMRHQTIAKSLNCDELNPYIKLEQSPFVISTQTQTWKRPFDGSSAPYPLTAGVSSFGFGGTNAHIVLQEYQQGEVNASKNVWPQLFIISAKTPELLKLQSESLLKFIEKQDIPLQRIVYTLQVGRVAQLYRSAFLVETREQLVQELRHNIATLSGTTLEEPTIKNKNQYSDQIGTLLAKLQADRTLSSDWNALATYWRKGYNVDWKKLYLSGNTIQRAHIPGTVFSKDEYWIGHSPSQRDVQSKDKASTHHIAFNGFEFFLADHVVQGRAVLPAAASLDIVAQYLTDGQEAKVLRLTDITWPAPYYGDTLQPLSLSIDHSQSAFTLKTSSQIQELQCCRGHFDWHSDVPTVMIDIELLKQQCQKLILEKQACYRLFADLGIEYGESHRKIEALYRNHDTDAPQVLAKLSAPARSANDEKHLAHPAILDAALQAIIGLTHGNENGQVAVPYTCDSFSLYKPIQHQQHWVHVAQQVHQGIKSYNVDMYCVEGTLICSLSGFALRHYGKSDVNLAKIGYYTPRWHSDKLLKMQGAPGRLPSNTMMLIDPSLIENDDEFPEAVRSMITYAPSDEGSIGDKSLALARLITELGKKDLKGEQEKHWVIVLNERQASIEAIEALLRTIVLEHPTLTYKLIVCTEVLCASQLYDLVLSVPTRKSAQVYDPQTESLQLKHWYKKDINAIKRGQPWREKGVYLIVGGAGGMGMHLARELLGNTTSVTVILSGRAMCSEQLQSELSRLGSHQQYIEYRQSSVDSLEDTERLIEDILARFGQVNGIFHCAGQLSDKSFVTHSFDDLMAVSAAKVRGAEYLDYVTQNMTLDFLCLSASAVSVVGNHGQAAYAFANGFLNSFAQQRNEKVIKGLRFGKTLSVNWPILADLGMTMSNVNLEALKATAGITPLAPTSLGEITKALLSIDDSQALVLHGDMDKAELMLEKEEIMESRVHTEQSIESTSDGQKIDNKPSLPREMVESFLKQRLSKSLKLPPERINANEEMEKYGIDSILITELTKELESIFGKLPKTLFFEFRTLSSLGTYFMTHHAQTLHRVLDIKDSATNQDEGSVSTVINYSTANSAMLTTQPDMKVQDRKEDIAIIGVAGRFPKSRSIEALWKNLENGTDCVTEVPSSRWNASDFTQANAKKLCQWGGFIDGVDEFDPLFFNISGREAEIMDPQERLFLQCAYETMESAGYRKDQLAQNVTGEMNKVGVFVGVMYMEYQLFGAQEQLKGNLITAAGNPASIANRVSYFFNFNGPSIALDTMCSSSLTAIHLAKQSIQNGECDYAIAGGVNVSVHPNKYMTLSMGNFTSSNGKCTSFGEGGDGYVPGEGVGAVLLKALSKAQEDGDTIHAIIKGSAINHGGKTNGYTVPSPQAQTCVISDAIADAQVATSQISYIEAHGTGTSLGDPIEIEALGRAIDPQNLFTHKVMIGSVKSNIGHCESAAGIAGLIKVLLQMRYDKLVPSLHSTTLNGNIDFDRLPFSVVQSSQKWRKKESNEPLLAGLSSFGAGGSNAHIIVQEHIDAEATSQDSTEPSMVVLSAKTAAQLNTQIENLKRYIDEHSVSLQALAYTLQIGRDMMDERFAVSVQSISQLSQTLAEYLDKPDEYGAWNRGNTKQHRDIMGLFDADSEIHNTVVQWINNGKTGKFLSLWVKGLQFDWSTLYQRQRLKRIPLPSYPFSRQRYWIEQSDGRLSYAVNNKRTSILGENLSDLHGLKYRVDLNSDDFFLKDHKVMGHMILPGSVYIEVARVASEAAFGSQQKFAPYMLKNISWNSPIVVPEHDQKVSFETHIEATSDSELKFKMVNSKTAAISHCQGKVALLNNHEQEPHELDLVSMETRFNQAEISGEEIYHTYNQLGICYGESMQGIKAIHVGEGEILSELVLPTQLIGIEEEYVVHPTMLDAAIHSAMALGSDDGQQSAKLAFGFEQMRIFKRCTETMWARVAYAHKPDQAVRATQRINVEMFDHTGALCLDIKGLSLRTWQGDKPNEVHQNHLLMPKWQARSIPVQSVYTMAEVQGENTLILVNSDNLSQLARQQHPQAQVVIVDSATNQYTLTESIVSTKVESVVCLMSAMTLPQPTSQMLEQLKSGLYSMFNIVKALEANGYTKQALKFTVVTLGGAQFSVNADMAAIHGFVGTVSKEFSRWEVRLCDIERVSDYRLSHILALPSDPLGNCLFLRKGQWMQEGLVEITGTSVFDDSFENQGVYVIVGGAGGIGQVLTRYLQSRYDAQVIWVGRSERNTALEAKLDSTVKGRSGTHYYQADASDSSALHKAVERIQNQFTKINGVFVSTVSGLDVSVSDMTLEHFNEGLKGKVAASVNVFDAFKHLQLDFLVYFSSLVSFTKDHGKASYSAGSVFLDAFARQSREVANFPIKVMNWGYWGDIGVASEVPDAFKKRMVQMGVGNITPEQGMQALEVLLAGPVEQTICVSTTQPGTLGKFTTGPAVQISLPSDNMNLATLLKTLDVPKLTGPLVDYVNNR